MPRLLDKYDYLNTPNGQIGMQGPTGFSGSLVLDSHLNWPADYEHVVTYKYIPCIGDMLKVGYNRYGDKITEESAHVYESSLLKDESNKKDEKNRKLKILLLCH